jgi:DNA helicase HerA-like ATPase
MAEALGIASSSSLDGHTLDYDAESDSPVLVGDLLTLRTEWETSLLVQIRTKERAEGRHVRGTGVVLGKLEEGALSPPDARPFSTATIDRADPGMLGPLMSRGGPVARVGTTRTGGLPALLFANSFNRHTFLCGQSGSGKTYALGVILEQLLSVTDLRMVILDPNGDFVRLGEIRPHAVEGTGALRAAQDTVRVFRPGSHGAEPLHLLWSELTRPAQGAVMQLDPIRDRGEYNVLLNLPTTDPGLERGDFLKEIGDLGEDGRAIATRLENLGILDWSLWARGASSVLAAIDERPRAAVLEIGTFDTGAERSASALAVLDHLWERRERREPTLIVIDEAHNICTTEPANELQALATERLVQIAGEGRKYGLWLLVSTQRPSKIHPNVLSQCDNLVLMRMNAPADLEDLGRTFGYAPPSMLRSAPAFAKGEVLLAGGFTFAPTIARIGGRLTPEGGSDVAVPLPSTP